MYNRCINVCRALLLGTQPLDSLAPPTMSSESHLVAWYTLLEQGGAKGGGQGQGEEKGGGGEKETEEEEVLSLQ